MGSLLTQEEVEKRFKNKGWKLIGIYVNKDTKIETICPHCKKNIFIVPNTIFQNNTQSCGCITNQLISEKNSTALKRNSLGYLYPEIAKLYSKNNKKSAFKIYPQSNKKYLWICETYGYKHEYYASANNIKNGTRCPYCTGKKILIGFNDLSTTHPELIEEWNYNKNKIKPTEISYGSGKKCWWKCSKCKHEWQASLLHRSHGRGCPECYPRSYGEEKIKQYLVSKNIVFKREKTFLTCKNENLLRFDFWIQDYNLLIEYNGIQHYKEGKGYLKGKHKLKKRQINDKIKEIWANDNQIKLLIISYAEYDNIENILQKVLK
uniref:Treble clef zinc finger domain-containing protein n=1 Tax=viral metagenome TaxID=1070528 RepID=A0A6M3IMH9_9ZZZZ